MAVKTCCVENCPSCSTRKEDKGVTYHKFPKDASSRNEWQCITRFKHLHKELPAYVCSRHFCKGDFEKNMDFKYILKSDAVPSIFPWTINSLNMDTSQIEESLCAIISDDEKNLPSSSKASEAENLEAIKKFIEEQEKEILEKKTDNDETDDVPEKEMDKDETHDVSNENKEQEKTVQELMDVTTSVMDMILTETEAKLAKENETNNSKPTLSNIEKSDQKINPNDKENGSMSLSVGSKVEVKDFGEDWYPAEIAEVDYDEMEVLVRYDIESKKHDEWISVSSPRLRPFTGTIRKPKPADQAQDADNPEKDEVPATEKLPSKEKMLALHEIKEEPKEDIVKIEEKAKVVFEVGERCLARWRDNRRFVATILKDLGDGKYEVLFDDGVQWTCSIARLHKMKADCLTIDTSFQSASAESPSPLNSGAGPSNAPISPSIPAAFHTHLFDPSRDYLGSKSERREKKRKLNIKEIFNIGQKKAKIPKIEKKIAPKASAEKKPRVKKIVAPKVPKVERKKEIKTEIPDAVASIIGTVKEETELQIKLERVRDSSNAKQKDSKTEKYDEPIESTENACETTEDIPQDETEVVDMEPAGCVNPNDETLDNEEMEESNSEGDPVLENEVKLENFEKQDIEEHEQVIDKIKEVISKLEDGISEIEKGASPKVERADTPKKEIEKPQEAKLEVYKEMKLELKDILAEVAASIDIGDSNADSNVQEKCSPKIEEEHTKVEKIKISKPRRDPSKVKKGKKLRLLQEKKVKRQVEKVKNELEQMKKQFEEMRKQMLMQTHDIVQGQESTPLPARCLPAGEWCCRWVNGQPVGTVSEVAGAVPSADGKPGLPRRSVQVEDKRLPPGWTKHMVRRSVGHSAGNWNVVFVSPDEHGNKRFHTKTDMRNFLEHYPDDSMKPYERVLTDFGVHLKTARRMGWILNTPDGTPEAPENIIPAFVPEGEPCILSPLVKRKKLNLKRRERVVSGKDKKRRPVAHKKRRPIKLKLQKGFNAYNSQLVGGESSSENQIETFENAFEPPIEDGYVYVGSLKVQIIDTLLRCPAEGCLKNFRTKTLLQMHIKHYHRELTKMMGATPKVLDLAYARTMPIETEIPQVDKKIIKVKINKPPRRTEEYKISESDLPEFPTEIPAPPVKTEDSVIPRIPRSQDSPKLRQALNHKPVKRPRVLLPVRRLEPETVEHDSIDDDMFDDQISETVVDVPTLPHPLDFETAISTHTVTKPSEKKKKADKKKCFASFSKNISEDEEWFAMNSDELDTRSSFPCSGSPDSKIMEIKMAPMSSESNDEQKDANLYTYTETGERVKIVHMKREEIINCHCGFREEDGLMVQCELCLCWQHALCHNIQRECEVPEKYTCSICLNPRRGRRSKRFLHDQDRLYEGLLPGAKPCESLRRSHELAGNLLRIDDALHALRVKFYVATKKDHPKLYLWAKDWEQAEITYTQEKLNSDYSDLNIMINGMDKENLPVKAEEVDRMDMPPQDEQDSERLSHRDTPVSSQCLLSGLLSSPGGASLDLPISTLELERLAKSVQESAEWQRVPMAPQPEAAIENDACRERLYRHIQRCQALIDTRLDSIEAQVAELESEDPSFGEHYETAEFYPRTKQTVQMLMRDLDTMEELGVIT